MMMGMLAVSAACSSMRHHERRSAEASSGSSAIEPRSTRSHSSSLLAPRFASATQKCVTQLGGLRGFRFSIGGAARYRSAAEASIAIGGGTPAPANTVTRGEKFAKGYEARRILTASLTSTRATEVRAVHPSRARCTRA